MFGTTFSFTALHRTAQNQTSLINRRKLSRPQTTRPSKISHCWISNIRSTFPCSTLTTFLIHIQTNATGTQVEAVAVAIRHIQSSPRSEHAAPTDRSVWACGCSGRLELHLKALGAHLVTIHGRNGVCRGRSIVVANEAKALGQSRVAINKHLYDQAGTQTTERGNRTLNIMNETSTHRSQEQLPRHSTWRTFALMTLPNTAKLVYRSLSDHSLGRW